VGGEEVGVTGMAALCVHGLWRRPSFPVPLYNTQACLRIYLFP
jgi:hypothetical protein